MKPQLSKWPLFRQKAYRPALFSLLFLAIALVLFSTLGCSRETTVYPDPVAGPAIIPPVVVDGLTLPKDFSNHSVNKAGARFVLDGITTTSKSVTFYTTSSTNSAGAFNGSGVGNRAIVGIETWNSRPVSQAEPITFDAHTNSGMEKIGVILQIDLKCDGTSLVVVEASGSAITSQPTVSEPSDFTRFTASTQSPIWLASTAPILDPDTSATLVPTSGAPVSLQPLLTKFSAACLKNGATGANDLPKGIATSAISWSLGTDSTASTNETFVRRFSIGSQVVGDFN